MLLKNFRISYISNQKLSKLLFKNPIFIVKYFSSNHNNPISDNNTFKIRSDKASEILKVSNTQFDNIGIDDTIRLLLLSGHFKSHPKELIPKIEKRLSKQLNSFSEFQLTKIIYGFALLKYITPTLHFNMERVLIKQIQSFDPKNFNTIFKSLAKLENASASLYQLIRNYINQKISKFKLYQMCDIFINYTKVIKIYNDEDKILIKKLFNQIEPHYEKLEINQLVNFYFILYSSKNEYVNELYKLVDYDRKYEIEFIKRSKEINSKLVYMIILTYHFKKDDGISINNDFKTFLMSKIDECLNIFTPDEINTIITILTNKNNKFDFEKDYLINSVYLKFSKIALLEIESMNIDELILYIQSLVLIINYIEERNDSAEEILQTLKSFEEYLMNNKINSMNLFNISSLLELINHFKKENLFKSIDLDNLTKRILNILLFETIDSLYLIFDDYYLIALFLFELKYSNKEFWKAYLNYLTLFNTNTLLQDGNKPLMNHNIQNKINKLLALKNILL